MGAWAAAILIVIGVVALYGWTQYRRGRDSIAIKQAKARQEQADVVNKIRKKVKSLSDDDLDRGL